MANGNRKPASEYYSDPVKYTGNAGSKTNPYCIEDVYDLNVYVDREMYYILVNDIDFNDHPIYKYGFTSNINYFDVRYGSGGGIDGRNHKILNVVVSDVNFTLIHACIIENIEFVNVVMLGTGLSSSGNGLVVPMQSAGTGSGQGLHNCIFSCLFANGHFASLGFGNNSTAVTDCTFNIKGTLSTSVLLAVAEGSSKTYRRCLWNVDIQGSRTLTGLIGASSSSYITTLQSCAFQGKINGAYVGSGTALFCYSNITNSYCDANIYNISSAYYLWLGNQTQSATLSDICFVNISTIRRSNNTIGYTDHSANLKELTTTQCHDKDYLQSIGFVTT